MRRCLLGIVLSCGMVSSVFAQVTVLRPIDLTGAGSPFRYPAPYWVVEVDRAHPGPELLVAQYLDLFETWTLALTVLDHPSRSGHGGAVDRPGTCYEIPVAVDVDFYSVFVTGEVLDLNHDGVTDGVVFSDTIADSKTRLQPVTLTGLDRCRMPNRRGR